VQDNKQNLYKCGGGCKNNGEDDSYYLYSNDGDDYDEPVKGNKQVLNKKTTAVSTIQQQKNLVANSINAISQDSYANHVSIHDDTTHW
jgi:hypothetical protein